MMKIKNESSSQQIKSQLSEIDFLKEEQTFHEPIMMETPPYTLLPSFVAQISLKSTCKKGPQ